MQPQQHIWSISLLLKVNLEKGVILIVLPTVSFLTNTKSISCNSEKNSVQKQ